MREILVLNAPAASTFAGAARRAVKLFQKDIHRVSKSPNYAFTEETLVHLQQRLLFAEGNSSH